MKNIVERMNTYIQTHPFDSGTGECETVLDQLFQAYSG